MDFREGSRRPVRAGEWIAGVTTGLLMAGALGIVLVQPEVQADVVHLVAEVTSPPDPQIGELPADSADITEEPESSQALHNPAGVQLGESFGEKLRNSLSG